MTSHPPLGLRAWLVQHRISVRALAVSVGRDPDYLSKVLQRRLPLTQSLALAIVETLRLGPDESLLLLGHPSSWGRGRWPDTHNP